jgi:hypothetical protein
MMKLTSLRKTAAAGGLLLALSTGRALCGLSQQTAEPENQLSAVEKVLVNSNPHYRALRDAVPAESYTVKGITLRRDAAVLNLHKGAISFLSPVMGKVCGAVFSGSGSFTLSPLNALEKQYMRFRTGEEALTESFDNMLLFFTDDSYGELKKALSNKVETPGAASALAKWRKTLRRNPDRPETFTESLLSGADVDNIEAEVLGELYSPSKPGLFAAYMAGQNYKDLRFHIRPRGALRFLPATDEVALLSIDPNEERDGILYLAHLGGALRPSEPKDSIDLRHYSIQTAIGNNRHLSATAHITFTAVAGGLRVVKFSLLPTLRVSKVLLGGETPVSFIQEDRQEDGSFFVVLPEALQAGKDYRLSISYAGDKVIEGAGGGNFSVRARTSWYPNLNAFTDYATYDLTFRVPKDFLLVSVGKLEDLSKDGGFAVYKWRSEVPVSVVGFNYGAFKKKELTDARTGYLIEGYAASAVPDYLRSPQRESAHNPSALIEHTMAEAQASIQLYTHWFGAAPFGRLAVTQQPEFNFGQSWPTLVYLPVSAFLDSTQRWLLLGSASFRFADFIQEVTPHEVAHQWWGHMVGWTSYRDQWISEGFAEFSASLFLEATNKNDSAYRTFLKRWTNSLLDKNSFGLRPNDVGPVATGFRLNTHRSPGAYGRVVYAKGGFILHMLRRMMADAKSGDQAFIAMMQDFVKTYSGRTASTEDFKAIAEKHMLPYMNLDGNGKLDWFFSQWVYGTEVPSYHMVYSVTPQDGGKAQLRFHVTQSDVSESFKSSVPVYVRLGDSVILLGRAAIAGSKPSPEITVLLPAQPREVLLNYNYDILAAKSAADRAN